MLLQPVQRSFLGAHKPRKSCMPAGLADVDRSCGSLDAVKLHFEAIFRQLRVLGHLGLHALIFRSAVLPEAAESFQNDCFVLRMGGHRFYRAFCCTGGVIGFDSFLSLFSGHDGLGDAHGGTKLQIHVYMSS